MVLLTGRNVEHRRSCFWVQPCRWFAKSINVNTPSGWRLSTDAGTRNAHVTHTDSIRTKNTHTYVCIYAVSLSTWLSSLSTWLQLSQLNPSWAGYPLTNWIAGDVQTWMVIYWYGPPKIYPDQPANDPQPVVTHHVAVVVDLPGRPWAVHGGSQHRAPGKAPGHHESNENPIAMGTNMKQPPLTTSTDAVLDSRNSSWFEELYSEYTIFSITVNDLFVFCVIIKEYFCSVSCRETSRRKCSYQWASLWVLKVDPALNMPPLYAAQWLRVTINHIWVY